MPIPSKYSVDDDTLKIILPMSIPQKSADSCRCRLIGKSFKFIKEAKSDNHTNIEYSYTKLLKFEFINNFINDIYYYYYFLNKID